MKKVFSLFFTAAAFAALFFGCANDLIDRIFPPNKIYVTIPDRPPAPESEGSERNPGQPRRRPRKSLPRPYSAPPRLPPEEIPEDPLTGGPFAVPGPGSNRPAEIYRKITRSPTDISDLVGEESEVYLFVYNTGDRTVTNRGYASVHRNLADSDRPAFFPYAHRAARAADESGGCFCPLANPRLKRVFDFAEPLSDSVGDGNPGNQNCGGCRRARHRASATPGDIERFYMPTYRNPNIEAVKINSAECLYVNGVCQIFAESGFYETSPADPSARYTRDFFGNVKLTPEGAKFFGEKFSGLFSKEQELIGEIRDLNGLRRFDTILAPEKITILFSNFDSPVCVGLFRTADLMLAAGSNERAMFFVNVAMADRQDSMVETLWHEFNHMGNFISKHLKHGLPFDTWLTEMLSTTISCFHKNSKHLSNFNTDTHIGMIDWGQSSRQTQYAYSFASAFGSYLVRNYGGVRLLHQIATNPFSGKEAVTQALQSCGYDETYDSVLVKFGIVMANTELSSYSARADAGNLSLNKSLTERFGRYSYTLQPVDLNAHFSVPADGKYDSYNNPRWMRDSSKAWSGPFFYKPDRYPDRIYAGGFYPVYIGGWQDSDIYDWSALPVGLPQDRDIQAYIYVKNPRTAV